MNFIQPQLEKLLKLSSKQLFIAYIFLDIICIGVGMGVPIFSIALGFPIGWMIIMRYSSINDIHVVLKELIKISFRMAAITFAGMILIWGWCILLLNGTDAAITQFGLPMILFTPRASLIGWMILMIVVSPILQMLVTVFAGNLSMLYLHKKKSPLRELN